MTSFLNALVKNVSSFFTDGKLHYLLSSEGFTSFAYGVISNPLGAVFVLMIVVKFLNSGPIKDVEGSLVKNIKSVEDWNEILDKSKAEGKIVVADFYANWCPPCKTAAPRFGLLSIEYANSNVIFIKVDIEKVSAVARQNGIMQMPTFKIIKDAKEVNAMVGWGEAALREMIEKSGGKKYDGDAKAIADTDTKKNK